MISHKKLLLLGAPKCGTSSVFNWLIQHPQIAGSQPKETYFFMDSDHPLYEMRGTSFAKDGAAGFKQLFADSTAQVLMEATTHNYYQTDALNAAKDNPETRTLFIVREPSRRLLSHFRYARDTRTEIHQDYSFDCYVQDLLAGTIEQSAGQFRNSATRYVLSRQMVLSDYAHWIGLWHDNIGPERFKVMVFEDIMRRPQAAMGDIAQWMGCDAAGLDGADFNAFNQTYRVANSLLHRFAWFAGSHMPTGKVKKHVKSAYMRLQNREAKGHDAFEIGMLKALEAFRPICDRLITQMPELQLRDHWRADAFSAS